MGKEDRGRGHSSSSPGRGQSLGFGRDKKNSKANAKTPAILTTGMDASKLHPLYVPRSPIRTRAVAKGTGDLQPQQQQQSGIGIASSSKSGSSTVPTSNEFEILCDISDEGDDQASGKENKGDDDLAAVANSSSVGTKKRDKVQPPIIVPNIRGSAVDKVLLEAGCDFCLKWLKESTKVITLNKPMYEKSLAALKAADIKYYTYDHPDSTPIKIVLSGYVPISIPELMEDLEEAKIKPRDAKIMSTKQTVTGEHRLYLLYFDRGSVKIQDLRKVKTMNGIIITWRYFSKRPTDAAQCHRCQRFGHGSRGCSMTPQCVKCGQDHLTGGCTMPKKAVLGENNNAEQHKQQVKCANCQGNHTANYRGCPARKKYREALEKRKKDQTRQQPPRPTNANHSTADRPAPPGWGRTYASVAAPASSAAVGPVDGANGDLFTLTEFLGLAREMFNRFQECQTRGQQFLALSELMGKYVFGVNV